MDATRTDNRASEQLLDIPALVGILWHRKLLIGACVAALVSLAFVYSVVTPSSYTATAVVLLDPREAVTIDSTNVLSGIGSDSAAIASQVAVISSPQLLRAVFDAENLAKDPEFSRPGLVSGMLSLLRGSLPAKSDAVIFETFRGRVDVDREGLTYVLNVSFVSSDPVKAARIVNAIVDQYISGQIAEKSGASTEVTGLLNDRIESLRDAVTQAEQAVERFRVENNIFDVGAGRTLLDTQVEQLNAQWVAAQEAVRTAANRYEQARTIGTSPEGLARLTDILSSPAAAELRNTYNLRLSALANAQATLGDRHPTRVALEAEITRLVALMSAEAERIIAELRAGKELAEASVIRIETDLAMLRTESSLSNQQSVELRQLERNADASRQVLEQFLARSQETSQLEQLQKSDARVISSATPPTSATWPRSKLLIAVAAMVGFMLGSGLALLLGDPRNHPRQRKTVGKKLKKGKRLTAGKQKRAQIQPRRKALSDTTSARKTKAKSQGALHTRFANKPMQDLTVQNMEDIQLEVADYPESRLAMDTQKLMYRLLGNVPEDQPVSAFMFSSVTADIEKVRLAFAMALTMRTQGLNPLILDLDPLMQSDAPDIEDLLEGYLDPDPEQLIDLTTGLTILTLHPDAEDDMEPDTASNLAARVFETLGHAFDAVIIIGQSVTDHRTETGLQGLDREIVVLGEDEDQQHTMGLLNKRARRTGKRTEFVTVHYGNQDLSVKEAFEPRQTTHEEQDGFATEYDDGDNVDDAVAELRRVVRYAGER